MIRTCFIAVILYGLQIGSSAAQTGVIKGKVYNGVNNDAIPFASIVIDSSHVGATSDEAGNYRIAGLEPGVYNLVCSFVGFKAAFFDEIIVGTTKPTVLNIPLMEETTTLGEVEVRANPFTKAEESPVSLRTIGATEIYRSPGGNRDISRIVQTLPGVAYVTAFRNDIIVRGGGPGENRFFLDGIEIPNINHFATQGSAGGSVGMINVNFVKELDFYAGAFPANRGNALSAVLELKQTEGNDERIATNIMTGSSDVGITLDGPMGKKSNFIFSVRHSFWEFLFKLFRLPFLPAYTDVQYKHTFRINKNNRITLIGLGALDEFKFNKEVNEGLDENKDKDQIRANNYNLANLPVYFQWNYTVGVNWTHFSKNSYQNVVVSRNHLNNSVIKYKDNIEQPEFLVQDYNSQEIENKIRIENTLQKKGWKWNAGIGYENVLYTHSNYVKTGSGGLARTIDSDSELGVNKMAIFTHLSKSIAKDKLTLSFGIRTDFNDYSNEMLNPLTQLSPRFSASYAITEKLNIGFNVGRYYQLPAYTVMGYRDSANTLVNKDNRLTYIQADHFVIGPEYNFNRFSKITLEGFYKVYNNYPFVLRDSISLANLGADYGVVGLTPVTSTSKGRSYGVELLLQQKLNTSIYGILSYTFVRSEFEGRDGQYLPSSWDNRHVLSLAVGKRFKRNWEVGAKFRLLGGAPYTPYDKQLSAIKNVWDVTRRGITDWSRLNQERYPVLHGLDIRVDKKWFFKKWTMNLYFDVQNVYNSKIQGQPYLDVQRDAQGNTITDPENPNAYKVEEVQRTSGSLLPFVGLMIEF